MIRHPTCLHSSQGRLLGGLISAVPTTDTGVLGQQASVASAQLCLDGALDRPLNAHKDGSAQLQDGPVGTQQQPVTPGPRDGHQQHLHGPSRGLQWRFPSPSALARASRHCTEADPPSAPRRHTTLAELAPIQHLHLKGGSRWGPATQGS